MAPMNIRKIITSEELFERLSIGMVENPAVLAETAWKKASSGDVPPAMMKSVPMLTRTKVMKRTIFVWNENLPHFLWWMTSFITMKPRPPRRIRSATTMFT